ncbi:MAG: MBL fold metallo-hydrolase [Deltaproteobacteria bacterium]|nr:MBL fold metallo-hydrolase [Deltaproteobacteria bacterium]
MDATGSPAVDWDVRAVRGRNGRYRNVENTRLFRGGDGHRIFTRFVFERGERVPRAPLPVVAPDVAALRHPPPVGVRATWLGHSTVLLEVDGRRVLCDPIWAERSTPVRGVGPRRFHPPPLPLAELPDPDVVAISHDHYDHLDAATVKALAARGARFAVPLGVGRRLARWGVPADRILERGWWETAAVVPGELELIVAPTRHFSGRGPLDRNRTQWASWIVRGRRSRVCFGGDGGWSAVFGEIGRRLGPFDLTLLEIGAFHPAWGEVHLGPANAVRAHRALGGRVLLPIHWGTFNLGLHAWHEPPEQLREAAAEAGIEFALPRPGQAVVVGQPLPTEPWWGALRS